MYPATQDDTRRGDIYLLFAGLCVMVFNKTFGVDCFKRDLKQGCRSYFSRVDISWCYSSLPRPPRDAKVCRLQRHSGVMFHHNSVAVANSTTSIRHHSFQALGVSWKRTGSPGFAMTTMVSSHYRAQALGIGSPCSSIPEDDHFCCKRALSLMSNFPRT